MWCSVWMQTEWPAMPAAQLVPLHHGATRAQSLATRLVRTADLPFSYHARTLSPSPPRPCWHPPFILSHITSWLLSFAVDAWNEGDVQQVTQPYQIPYWVVLPKRDEATNLLSVSVPSASHVGFSTLRMEASRSRLLNFSAAPETYSKSAGPHTSGGPSILARSCRTAPVYDARPRSGHSSVDRNQGGADPMRWACEWMRLCGQHSRRTSPYA